MSSHWRFVVPILLGGLFLPGCGSSSSQSAAGKKGGTVPRLGGAGADEPDLAALTNHLKDKNPTVRKTAATQLGEKGSDAQEAAEALKELLADADQSVQRAAAVALAKILKAEAGEVAPLLVEMVKEEKDPANRHDLIQLLAEIGPGAREAALGDLAALLGDPDVDTRRGAAYAVSRIAPGEVPEALPILLEFLVVSEPTMRLILGDAIAPYGPAAADAVPHLKGFLKDNDPIIRRTAAYSLVRIQGAEGTDAIRILVEAVKDEDAQTRMVYAMILGSLGPVVAEQGAPALLLALKDEDVMVRRMAAASLIAVDKGQAAEAIPIIIEALSEPDTATRIAALKALGELGAASAEAVPQAVKLLAEEDLAVRRTAAYALVQILGSAATDALPVLIADLADEDPITRDIAAVSLIAFGPAAAEAVPALNKILLNEMPSSRWAAALALVHIEGAEAKAALAVLAEALRDMDPDIRLRFATVLGELGTVAADALPALNAALKDEELQVRRTAALSITQIDPMQAAGAVKVLTEGLSDEAPEVREQMATTLGGLQSTAMDAVPALTKLMKDEVMSVRLAGAIALLQIQGAKAEGAAEVVNQSLSEGDPLTRASHVWALFGLGEVAAPTLPALTKLLKHEDLTLRRAAAFAVLRLQGVEKSREALAVVIEGFSDPDPATRAMMVSGMGTFKSPAPSELLEALQKALKDEEQAVRWESAVALLRIQGGKSEGANEVVSRSLAEGDPGGRTNLVWTLLELGEAATSALPALTKLLKDEDITLRRTAAHVVLRLQGLEKSKDALAVIIAGFSDPDPATRAMLVGDFKSIKPPAPTELIEALKKSLKDEDETVRTTAEAVLKHMTTEPTKEPTREPIKEPAKEPPSKEPTKEPAKQ